MTTARPFLMFQNGCAQAALDLYFGTLPDSRMVRVECYAEGEAGPAGSIKVAVFTLCGRSSVQCCPRTPQNRRQLIGHGAHNSIMQSLSN